MKLWRAMAGLDFVVQITRHGSREERLEIPRDKKGGGRYLPVTMKTGHEGHDSFWLPRKEVCLSTTIYRKR